MFASDEEPGRTVEEMMREKSPEEIMARIEAKRRPVRTDWWATLVTIAGFIAGYFILRAL